MQLVNMSSRSYVNFLGLNFPCLVEDVDGDLSYEHTLVPFIGCEEYDFAEFNGITKLLAHVEPRISENTLVLVKQQNQEDDGRLLFLYSFPVMDNAQFGSYPGTTSPDLVYKFASGNPDIGYFFEMIFVLQKDIKYEVLYHSEILNKVTKIELLWNAKEDYVSVIPSILM